MSVITNKKISQKFKYLFHWYFCQPWTNHIAAFQWKGTTIGIVCALTDNSCLFMGTPPFKDFKRMYVEKLCPHHSVKDKAWWRKTAKMVEKYLLDRKECWKRRKGKTCSKWLLFFFVVQSLLPVGPPPSDEGPVRLLFWVCLGYGDIFSCEK